MTQMGVGPVVAYRVPNRLASDTGESVVGTEWHQEAIGALADMLREAAYRRGAAWGVCEQVALIGLRHENGTDYDPRPDVMVLRQPLPHGSMASIHLRRAGAPLFIAEVASASTKANDQSDKRQAYEAIGILEYLVFDPDGDLLTTPLLAWRLEDGAYVPWTPGADGWWHSAALDVSFALAQPFLRVRDRDGVPIELPHEVRRRARDLEQHSRDLEQRLREAGERLAAEERARADDAQRRAALEEQVRRLQELREHGDHATGTGGGGGGTTP